VTNQLPAIVYLHGLGASPESKKGELVRARFEPQGYLVKIPDLNAPSLPKLSIHDALQRARHELCHVGERSVFLVGSSFGGFLALHLIGRLTLSERKQIRGIVLLGPVTDPWDPESRLVKPEVERQWFETGEFPIVSSDEGQLVGVHYGFLRELREFAGSTFVLGIPVLIVHGVRDTVVSKEQSVRFAEEYPSVELVLLDEEHQLLENPQLFLGALERFIREQHSGEGQVHV